MAKKDNDNFDFETEGKAKGGLSLDFLKNLTKKQKGIILIAAVAVVLVVAIVITCIALGTNNGGTGNGGNNGGGSGGDGNSIFDTFIPASIDISATPSKISYYVGDSPDYSGLSIAVTSTYGRNKNISYDLEPDALVITGFDSSTPVAEQVITVEYEGLTDAFIIEIKEIETVAPDLVGIEFVTMPRTEFNVDDTFSYDTGVLLCTYSDGSTKEVPLHLDYMHGWSRIFDNTGDHIMLPGEHTIQIEYGENGVFVQTEYTITVTE